MVPLNPRPHAWRETAGEVAVSFVDAVNRFDVDRLIDLFVEDAHVNDQLRDFWGKDAIGNWLRREIVGERFCMDVIEARVHYDNLIVSAVVGGDFDKTGLPTPLILSFIFSFFDGKIARLLILMTRPGEAEPDIRVAGV